MTADADCRPCGTSGKLNLDIKINIEVSMSQPVNVTASLTPQDLGASFTLDLSVSGNLTNEFNKNFLPLTVGLPSSIVIPPDSNSPVLTMRSTPNASILAELSKVTAESILSFGTNIPIQDSPVASVDLLKPSNDRFSGWTPTFTPMPLNVDASVLVSGPVAPLIALELGVEVNAPVIAKKSIGAGIGSQAPQFSVLIISL